MSDKPIHNEEFLHTLFIYGVETAISVLKNPQNFTDKHLENIENPIECLEKYFEVIKEGHKERFGVEYE